MALEELPVGTVVEGLRIEGLLGRGGMATVYAARDERIGRLVALKVASRDLSRDPRFVERFEREARALGALSHPNVVSVHSVGVVQGLPFMALEHVPGGTLDDRVKKGGPMPWREAAQLGAGVARALGALHAAGLVHRDLKPANVLLDAEGRPKLSDLGLARGQTKGASLTGSGELLGTLEYMAPEQAESSDVGPAADLYALGATLFALVAGRPPFEGRGFELVKKHAVDRPAALRDRVPGVPSALSALVGELLAKEPVSRPASAVEVARRLDEIASDSGRGSKRAIVAGVGVLAILGSAGVVISRGGPPPPVPPAPVPSPPVNRVAPVVPAPPVEKTRRIATTDLGTPVISLSFSPDGKTLVSGGFDGSIRLWDTAGLTPMRQLAGHVEHPSDRKVESLVWTPDGSALFSAGQDGTVRRWEVTTGKLVNAPTPHGKRVVRSLAISADGKRLASGGYDGRVLLWDLVKNPTLEEGAAQRFFGFKRGSNDQTVEVSCVAFAPSGSSLAVGLESELCVIDTANPEREHFRMDVKHGIRSVGFLDPSVVVYGEWWGDTAPAARAVNLETKKLLDPLVQHTRPVTRVIPVGPDAVVVSSFDGLLELVTQVAQRGRSPVVTMIEEVPGRGSDDHCDYDVVAVSKDGRLVATGHGLDGRGTIRLFALAR